MSAPMEPHTYEPTPGERHLLLDAPGSVDEPGATDARRPDAGAPHADPAHRDAAPDELALQLQQAHQQVEDATRRYPWAAVATAVGVGVVLGGGIPTWVLRFAAASAARLATVRLVDTLLAPPTDS